MSDTYDPYMHQPWPHKGHPDPGKRCPWCDNWNEGSQTEGK